MKFADFYLVFSLNFNFISAATTLTGFHFTVTALVGWVSNATGFSASKQVPLWELLWFSIVANLSITSMNLSLMLNSVGFYQVCLAFGLVNHISFSYTVKLCKTIDLVVL